MESTCNHTKFCFKKEETKRPLTTCQDKCKFEDFRNLLVMMRKGYRIAFIFALEGQQSKSFTMSQVANFYYLVSVDPSNEANGKIDF